MRLSKCSASELLHLFFRLSVNDLRFESGQDSSMKSLRNGEESCFYLESEGMLLKNFKTVI